ncbi:virion structural protein [Pseudomonas phage vB_PpuM-NoPa]|uniref:Virion structural protein n=4 Tax=Tartuvirus TaxID=3424912 RepID=A0AAX4MXM9_9CAUD
MTRLTDIIDIQITRETAAVAQTNFNVPLFIAAHAAFSERARTYSTPEAVAEDFGTSGVVYTAASKLFSQQLKPTKIVIGRRHVPSVTVSTNTVSVGVSYTLTITGQTFSYTSVALDTAVEIMAGLKTAYNVSPIIGVTVTDNLDGTLTVAAPVDVNYSVKVSSNLTTANAPSTESWPDAVEAVQAVDDTWYALCIESHLTADVLATAAAIEAKKKIFGTSSNAQDVQTTSTTDLFTQLKDLGYQRTFGVFSATADSEYPECAWIGYQLQEQPGSNTWAYKELAGVTVSRLSDTVSKNILDKNGNTYEAVGSLNSTVGGKMFGGEWIDVIVFVDWLEQRMKERLWFRMRNSKKIPYTAAGAAIIEAEVRAQLNDGIRAGGLADSPAPIVSVPDVLSVSANLRAQRIFEGITFEARLAGAIHFVKIRGTVTV